MGYGYAYLVNVLLDSLFEKALLRVHKTYCFSINHIKRQSQLQQTTIFPHLPHFGKKSGMIFHENRLPADDFHEISYLISYF